MEKPDASPTGIEPDGNHAPLQTRTRLLDLALVLFVSLIPFVARSLYYFMGGEIPSEPLGQKLRLWSGLITELSSLLILWHVLFRQGRKWRNIGLDFSKSDVVAGIGLFLWVTIITYLIYIPAQYIYQSATGHYYQPKALHLGLGVSALSVVVLCLNPFFEELIVRAFTMTEILDLSRSRWLAMLVSVAAQMSYHFYQGWFRSIGLTMAFAFFSLYFLQTRRIMPVILAHLGSDLMILFRGGQ